MATRTISLKTTSDSETMTTDPNDGRYLDEGEDPSFFTLTVRMPRLIDIAAFAVIFAGSTLFFQSYLNGNYGVMAHRVIEEEHSLLRAQSLILDRRIQDQQNLNHRLSNEFLDLDLLEERSRVLLGYQHATDVLIED